MKQSAQIVNWSFATLAFLLMGLSFLYGQASNGFHSGDLWMDDKGVAINAHGGGMIYVYGTYYWFGEHKVAGTAGNVAHVGVHVYASKDLYHWSDKGIALSISSKHGDEIEDGCIIERPKVIFNKRTNKFVMWFHLELKGHGYSTACCGVAVADKVTGPFTFVKSLRPDAGAWPATEDHPLVKVQVPGLTNPLARDFGGGQMSRDMTIFQDDDGKAYLISASEDNLTIHISLLADDYLGTAGKYARAFVNRNMEAPVVFKAHGNYYMICSGQSGWKPNAARSAVASRMLGPWTELSNPCLGTKDEQSTTFKSQSTYVLPVAGKPNAFIFMADRWNPENAIDDRYIWLPVEFIGDLPTLKWRANWSLDVFDSINE